MIFSCNISIILDSGPWLTSPDRTTGIGKTIDAYLTSSLSLPAQVIHLLFSANRWEVMLEVRGLLKAGTTVLIDRYAYSGAAYSAAKGIEGLDLMWAWAADVGLPRPDVIIFLDLKEEEAAQRADWGAERYETKEMQRAVRLQFEQLWACKGVGNVVRVNAGDAMEVVESKILDEVLKVWEEPLSEVESLKKLVI